MAIPWTAVCAWVSTVVVVPGFFSNMAHNQCCAALYHEDGEVPLVLPAECEDGGGCALYGVKASVTATHQLPREDDQLAPDIGEEECLSAAAIQNEQKELFRAASELLMQEYEHRVLAASDLLREQQEQRLRAALQLMQNQQERLAKKSQEELALRHEHLSLMADNLQAAAQSFKEEVENGVRPVLSLENLNNLLLLNAMVGVVCAVAYYLYIFFAP